MAEPVRNRVSPASQEEAERFVAAFAGTIEALERLLEEETGHLAAGRIRQGLAQEARKTELAAGYLKGLEYLRSNAVALARFAPVAIGTLKGVHETFRAAVERNQAVIATARAVSEGLVKGVAEEVARRARPSGYGTKPLPNLVPARPLVFSARL